MLKPQYRDESFHKEVQLPFLKQKYILGRFFLVSGNIVFTHIEQRGINIENTCTVHDNIFHIIDQIKG